MKIGMNLEACCFNQNKNMYNFIHWQSTIIMETDTIALCTIIFHIYIFYHDKLCLHILDAGFDTNTVLWSLGHQKLARDFLTSKSEVPLGLLNFEEKHNDYEFLSIVNTHFHLS
jgi:hypothetical protein